MRSPTGLFTKQRCRELPDVCPKFRAAAELIGRMWTAAVISVALDGPVRFTQIREAVPGLSARLLTERLRALEAAGVVERADHPCERDVVVVCFTEKGRALRRVVDELQAWADRERPAR
jgi:DNA-binding HxlR family transcriptional regulator